MPQPNPNRRKSNVSPWEVTPVALNFPSIDEGTVIPVVYGIQEINGFYLQFGGATAAIRTRKSYIETDQDNLAYIPFWLGLCFGKVELIKIIQQVGDTYNVIVRPHTLYPAMRAKFNDGTETYYPADLKNNAGNTLEFLNKLPGIAHQYFDIDTLIKIAIGFENGQSVGSLLCKVHRILTGAGIIGADLNDGSSSPVAVIYDLMTNSQYGCGMSPTRFDLDSWNAAAEYTASMGYGVNMTIAQPGQLRTIVDSLCAAYFLRIWKSRDGIFKIRAYDPDHITHYKGTIVESDFIDFKMSRKQIVELPNEFKCTIRNGISADSTEQVDLFEVKTISIDPYYQIVGNKNIREPDLSFVNYGASKKLINRIAATESFPGMTIEGETNMQFADAEPMDVYMVTNDEAGINNIAFRVKSVQFDDGWSNELKLVLEQAIEKTNQYETGLGDVNLRQIPKESDLSTIQTATFPPFSATCTMLSTKIMDKTKAVLVWSAHVPASGILQEFVDYTMTESVAGGGYDYITLTAKWIDIYQANSTGRLTLKVYETT